MPSKKKVEFSLLSEVHFSRRKSFSSLGEQSNIKAYALANEEALFSASDSENEEETISQVSDSSTREEPSEFRFGKCERKEAQEREKNTNLISQRVISSWT